MRSQAVRDNLTGLAALYRPATMAERICDEFREGRASLFCAASTLGTTSTPSSWRG